MSNEDGSIRITMNGEIYNFAELREALEKKGHKFISRTDTEVILHLYEDKGTDCVRDLRGMFAFGIWDAKKERLFLARDRLGKKPLFYSFKSGNLVFASELDALLQDTAVGRGIDPASVDDFLNYQYIPAPFTIFKEVKKLPPAHFLVLENKEARVERYWNLDYSKKLDLSEPEYCERILELLTESTKIRLVSDVPLGAFLSGGIDSSAIVGVMARLMDRPVKTFSIGFEDKSFDETLFARIVAKRFGTEHKEFVVKPMALEVLPELVRHFGEPYGDPSAIPTYYLSKLTRRDVTVALNGDAGDESFGGYDRYAASKIAERYKAPLSMINKILGAVIKKFPESTNRRDKASRIKRFLDASSYNKDVRYSRLMSIFNESQRADAYSDYMRDEIKQNGRGDIFLTAHKKAGTDDIIDAMLFTDLMTYMPGDLLPKVDIASMANSLEARSPFLDHKFLEFSAGIPSHMKIRGTATKYILKKALKGLLPDEILKREKMGFGVPIGRWFKEDLQDYVYGILLEPRSTARGYFKTEKIKGLLDAHKSGKANNGARIWSLLNLELWHRVFIDKTGA
jgi:asparagine synthase (glutamine-hydrolysing)